MAPARVVPEVVEEPECVDTPDPFDLASEGQRLVPVRLDEREVVTRLRNFGAACGRGFLERSDRFDPDLGDGNSGDERRDSRRRSRAGDGMVDSGRMQSSAHRVCELARLPGEPVCAHPSHGTVRVLLGPQVQQRGGIGDAADPSRTRSIRRDQPFRLEASENAVRKTDRDARFTGEVLDLPFALRIEEQRLGCDAALPREPGVRLRARCVAPSTTLRLRVDEQPRELDVSIPETVDNGDPVALEDLARFRRRRSRDEQDIAVGGGPRLLHDLPRRGGVGPSLDLDGDGLGRPAEAEHGVASTAATGRTSRLDRDAGDLT